jgi:hypothetical protein
MRELGKINCPAEEEEEEEEEEVLGRKRSGPYSDSGREELESEKKGLETVLLEESSGDGEYCCSTCRT